MVQWLGPRLGAFTAVGLGSIPASHAAQPKKKTKNQKKTTITDIY